jgi:endonuclease/exonuclease/phosphatase family metal-dependent hydrolase
LTEPVERFLESHPQAAQAWVEAMARVVGRVMLLPGLSRWLPLAQRVHALARPTESGTVLDKPGAAPPPAREWLTVASANLWHDWPRQHRWSDRLESVARLVEAESIDILLLQEIARTRRLEADRWLAGRLGMSVAYARANGAVDAIGFEEGLAVLSRYPIGCVHLRQLSRSRNPLVRRIALGAEVMTPHGVVLAVTTHLGLVRKHNARQVSALREWVAAITGGEVAVIGGDFNAPETSAEMTVTSGEWTDTFRRANPESSSSTYASRAPWGRWTRPRLLDYVFVQQPIGHHWQVADSHHVDAPGGQHSDHRAVVTRLVPG